MNPIVNKNGATVLTGEGIAMFSLLSLRGMMTLEEKGLHGRNGRWGAHARAMQMFGIKGNATSANRRLAMQKLEDAIDAKRVQLVPSPDAMRDILANPIDN